MTLNDVIVNADGTIKVWLDDDCDMTDSPYRNPRLRGEHDWTLVKTVKECIYLFENFTVGHASFDNDLGDFETLIDEDTGETYVKEHIGYHVVEWLAEQSFNGNDRWPTQSIAVHSSNGPRVEAMRQLINRYSQFNV